MSNPSGVSTSGSEPVQREASHTSSLPAPKPQDETERLLGLQIALKCADLGHLAAERGVHER